MCHHQCACSKCTYVTYIFICTVRVVYIYIYDFIYMIYPGRVSGNSLPNHCNTLQQSCNTLQQPRTYIWLYIWYTLTDFIYIIYPLWCIIYHVYRYLVTDFGYIIYPLWCIIYHVYRYLVTDFIYIIYPLWCIIYHAYTYLVFWSTDISCRAVCSIYLYTHCNTLQHTATHCNTLQHSATLSMYTFVLIWGGYD